MSTTILRLPRVTERTGLSRSTIYARMAEGAFPPSVSIGERAVGWLSTEIDAWLEDRIKASRPRESGEIAA